MKINEWGGGSGGSRKGPQGALPSSKLNKISLVLLKSAHFSMIFKIGPLQTPNGPDQKKAWLALKNEERYDRFEALVMVYKGKDSFFQQRCDILHGLSV